MNSISFSGIFYSMLFGVIIEFMSLLRLGSSKRQVLEITNIVEISSYLDDSFGASAKRIGIHQVFLPSIIDHFGSYAARFA